MPWSIQDVDRFKKGLNTDDKKKWVSIANNILKTCISDVKEEKHCASKAIRIANSRFKELMNPVLSLEVADYIKKNIVRKKEANKMKEKNIKKTKSYKQSIENIFQTYQQRKVTPADPFDEHTHDAAFDEDGIGGTSIAGFPAHTHIVSNFKVQPFYYYDQNMGINFTSVHPGSLAFENNFDFETLMNCPDCPEEEKADMMLKIKECMKNGKSEDDCKKDIMSSLKENKNFELLTISEMEIFRIGTHNDDEFSDDDLKEIASNFHILKSEVRPKLKITHRESQKSLAGLSSYGDIVDIYLKKDKNGENRLYAKVENVPEEVISFIKERRFPERSIEIYPEFKLGTQKDSPVYRNVLKAIALLGHEMPAVTGMAPIKINEFHEKQKTICFKEVCYCEEDAIKYLTSIFSLIDIKYRNIESAIKKIRKEVSINGS